MAPEFRLRYGVAGASAAAIHGRFAARCIEDRQRRRLIGLCDAVSIPVIVLATCLLLKQQHMPAETGVTALMIARGTYGNPWIFKNTRFS